MKEIALTHGYKAMVDDEDFEALSAHRWRVDRTTDQRRYAVRHMGRTPVRMHAVIMGTVGMGRSLHVDHIDRNGLNNQRSNLRIVSPAFNRANGVKFERPCSSAYKGVHFVGRLKVRPWQARISIGGKHLHIGYFTTEEDAATAYNFALEEHYGEQVVFNVPIAGGKKRTEGAGFSKMFMRRGYGTFWERP